MEEEDGFMQEEAQEEEEEEISVWGFFFCLSKTKSHWNVFFSAEDRAALSQASAAAHQWGDIFSR